MSNAQNNIFYTPPEYPYSSPYNAYPSNAWRSIPFHGFDANYVKQNPLAAGLQLGLLGAASGLGYAMLRRHMRLRAGNKTPVSVFKPLLIGTAIGSALGFIGATQSLSQQPKVPIAQRPKTWGGWYDKQDFGNPPLYKEQSAKMEKQAFPAAIGTALWIAYKYGSAALFAWLAAKQGKKAYQAGRAKQYGKMFRHIGAGAGEALWAALPFGKARFLKYIPGVSSLAKWRAAKNISLAGPSAKHIWKGRHVLTGAARRSALKQLAKRTAFKGAIPTAAWTLPSLAPGVKMPTPTTPTGYNAGNAAQYAGLKKMFNSYSKPVRQAILARFKPHAMPKIKLPSTPYGFGGYYR